MARPHAAAASRVAVAGASSMAMFGIVAVLGSATPDPASPPGDTVLLGAPEPAPMPTPTSTSVPPTLPSPAVREIVIIRRHRVVVPSGAAIPPPRAPIRTPAAAGPATTPVTAAPRPATIPPAAPATTTTTRPSRPKPAATSRAS